MAKPRSFGKKFKQGANVGLHHTFIRFVDADLNVLDAAAVTKGFLSDLGAAAAKAAAAAAHKIVSVIRKG